MRFAQTARSPVPLQRQAGRIAEFFAGGELPTLLGEPFVAGAEPPREAVAFSQSNRGGDNIWRPISWGKLTGSERQETSRPRKSNSSTTK